MSKRQYRRYGFRTLWQTHKDPFYVEAVACEILVCNYINNAKYTKKELFNQWLINFAVDLYQLSNAEVLEELNNRSCAYFQATTIRNWIKQFNTEIK